MKALRLILSICVLTSIALAAPRDASTPPPVKSLRITMVSTMLAEKGIGEWGFSALVEVDGGVSEDVLANIRKLPLVKQANALSF